MDLYGIANNLDIFMRTDAKRQFPAITRSMIVPGQVLRSEATRTGAIMYMERYIDEDPDSLYLFIQCDARKGDASRDMAHQFFDKFFYDILHMPSTYDRASGMQPTQENPEFGRYDRNMAIHREILPAMDDTTFRRYYDEQVRAAQQEMARMMGIDPEEGGEEEAAQAKDDSDVIDMVDDGNGHYSAAGTAARAGTKAVQAHSGFAVGSAKPIFYAVDFHAPAAMQLGYNGDANNIAYDSARGMAGIQRLGRGPNRRQLREEKAEEELEEGAIGSFFKGVKQGFLQGFGKNISKRMISCFKPILKGGDRLDIYDVQVVLKSKDGNVVTQCGIQKMTFNDGKLTVFADKDKDRERRSVLWFVQALRRMKIYKFSQIKNAYVCEEGSERYAENYPVSDVTMRGNTVILWVVQTEPAKQGYASMLAETPEDGEELEEGLFDKAKGAFRKLIGKNPACGQFADCVKKILKANPDGAKNVKVKVMLGGDAFGMLDMKPDHAAKDSGHFVVDLVIEAGGDGKTLEWFLDNLRKMGVKKLADVGAFYAFEKGKQDSRFDNPVTEVSVSGDELVLKVAGQKNGKYADMLETEPEEELEESKYGWFVREALENGDGPDSWFVRESDDPLHDEIAGMFKGYSGGSSWDGRDSYVGKDVDGGDDEKKVALSQKSRADGFGDFSHAGDEDADMQECDLCGDPACRDGELCGLGESLEGGVQIGAQLLNSLKSLDNGKMRDSMISIASGRIAKRFNVVSFERGILKIEFEPFEQKGRNPLTVRDFLQELRRVGVRKISEIEGIMTSDNDLECVEVGMPNSMGNIFLEMNPVERDYKSEFGDILSEKDLEGGEELEETDDMSPAEFFCKPETAADAGDSEGGDEGGEPEGGADDEEDGEDLEENEFSDVVNESFSTQQIRGWNRLIVG